MRTACDRSRSSHLISKVCEGQCAGGLAALVEMRPGGADLHSSLMTYEALKGSAEQELARHFESLGLAPDPQALRHIVGRDSQAGSSLGRAGSGRDQFQMRPQDLEEARGIFERSGMLDPR